MKNRMLMATLFASAVALTTSFPHVALAQTAAAAPAVSDDALVAAVKAALSAKPELKADDLKITSKQGEVTIAGTVDSGRQLVNIANAAQAVPGVKFVINEMFPKQ